MDDDATDDAVTDELIAAVMRQLHQTLPQAGIEFVVFLRSEPNESGSVRKGIGCSQSTVADLLDLCGDMMQTAALQSRPRIVTPNEEMH